MERNPIGNTTNTEIISADKRARISGGDFQKINVVKANGK